MEPRAALTLSNLPPVEIPRTPSLRFQNLTGTGPFLAYSRENTLYYTRDLSTFKSVEEKDTGSIREISFFRYPNLNVLVVTTETGLEVWDVGDPGADARLLYCASIQSGYFGIDASFLQGIGFLPAAATEAFDGYAFIGSSTGAVSIFEVSKENTRFLSTCAIHKDSVTCISSTCVNAMLEGGEKSPYFMSGDENGGVVFWSFHPDTNSCIIRRVLHIEDDYCTCARSFEHFIIGGFGTGRVLVWLVDESMIDSAGPHEDGSVVDFAEIAAHARSINAMDVCATNGLLATAAEDSVVCVFQLPKSENGDVVFMATRVLENFGLLSGISFAHSELLAVAAYDQKRLWMLSCDSQ